MLERMPKRCACLVHQETCLEINQTPTIADRVGLCFDTEFLPGSDLPVDTERDGEHPMAEAQGPSSRTLHSL
jgi:hypothetical protein